MYRVKLKFMPKWSDEFETIEAIQVIVKRAFGKIKYSVYGRVPKSYFMPRISPNFDTAEEALDFAERVVKAYPPDDENELNYCFDCIENFPEFDIKLI